MRNAQYNNRTCPFLGLLDDADTSLDFPSVWNYCHRARPIAPRTLNTKVNSACVKITIIVRYFYSSKSRPYRTTSARPSIVRTESMDFRAGTPLLFWLSSLLFYWLGG